MPVIHRIPVATSKLLPLHYLLSDLAAERGTGIADEFTWQMGGGVLEQGKIKVLKKTDLQ